MKPIVWPAQYSDESLLILAKRLFAFRFAKLNGEQVPSLNVEELEFYNIHLAPLNDADFDAEITDAVNRSNQQSTLSP